MVQVRSRSARYEIVAQLPLGSVQSAREYELTDDYGHTIGRGKTRDNDRLSKGDYKYPPDDEDDDDEDKVEKEVKVGSSPAEPSSTDLFSEMDDEEENDDEDDWEDESKVRKKVALNTKNQTELTLTSLKNDIESPSKKIVPKVNLDGSTVSPNEDNQSGQLKHPNPGDPFQTLMVKVYRGPTKTVDQKPFASWGYFIKYPTEKS